MRQSLVRGRAWPWVVQATGWMVLAGLGMLGFLRLGVGRLVAVGLVAGVVIGGGYDLPLPRAAHRDDKPRVVLNIGGGLIPLLLAVYVGTRLGTTSWWVAVGAILLIAAASYASARPVADQGTFAPWLMIGMLAAALGLVLAPSRAPNLAYVSAVVGSFLGADLLMLSALDRMNASPAGLGGAGPFDGLVWTGLLAAYLAG